MPRPPRQTDYALTKLVISKCETFHANHEIVALSHSKDVSDLRLIRCTQAPTGIPSRLGIITFDRTLESVDYLVKLNSRLTVRYDRDTSSESKRHYNSPLADTLYTLVGKLQLPTNIRSWLLVNK